MIHIDDNLIPINKSSQFWFAIGNGNEEPAKFDLVLIFHSSVAIYSSFLQFIFLSRGEI